MDLSEAQTMSNWLSGVDLADVARLGDVVVLAVDRDRALRCVERDGAVFAAAFTASTPNEPAFSTMSLYRYSEM